LNVKKTQYDSKLLKLAESFTCRYVSTAVVCAGIVNIGKDFLFFPQRAGQRQHRSPKTKRHDIRFHGDVLTKR
jgi:hypothetical protein